MGETRVDLQHLLEDLRDAYTGALEETILTEIVANALDSGARRIQFLTRPHEAALTVIDDGRVVRIVTDRPLQVGDAAAPPDTVGYVELTLDASGKGTGRLMTAVKATFDAEGFVVPESVGETWTIADVKSGS